jgi:putative membrane protein insertion efficiency factor
MAARLALALIRAYQLIMAPLLTGSCRFAPSCSVYAAEAVREHGAMRGSWLGFRRISKCHPFGPAGYDPVPPRQSL